MLYFEIHNVSNRIVTLNYAEIHNVKLSFAFENSIFSTRICNELIFRTLIYMS